MAAGAELLELVRGDAVHGGWRGSKRVPLGQSLAARDEIREEPFVCRQQDSRKIGSQIGGVTRAEVGEWKRA